jgi:hypothetical protein
VTHDEATKQAKAYRGNVIQALATLLHAANDLAPEAEPDKYDAWRMLVMRARFEHDALAALTRAPAAHGESATGEPAPTAASYGASARRLTEIAMGGFSDASPSAPTTREAPESGRDCGTCAHGDLPPREEPCWSCLHDCASFRGFTRWIAASPADAKEGTP